jgi:hypothetical protein
MAQNIANRPYESYDMPTVAELSPLQQLAYKQVQANQGNWQPGMNVAQAGMQGMATAGTAGGLNTAQSQYLSRDLAERDLRAGLNYYDKAGKLDIVGAGQGALSQAGQQNIMGAASPYLSQAGNVDIMGAGADSFGAAGKINAVAAADPYLSRASKMSALENSQNLLNASSSQDIYGAAQPYMSQAGSAAGNIYGAAQPFMNQAGVTTAQALSDRALNAANPYLTAASRSSAQGIEQYMSPYQTGAMDVLAKQGARNLSENLLPAVSDQFIRAGQFGGSRMGEFGSRALRDTQESVLNQQAQMANQGYGQALAASQADLARQAQLAGTVGSISGADLSRVLQGGAQYGNLGQTQGQLTAQQASTLGNLGQTQGQLTAQQAQNLLSNAQATGQMTTADQAALQNIGQTYGQLSAQQMANMTNLGQAQTQAAAQQAANRLAVGQAAGQLTGQQQQNLTNLGQTQGQLTGQQMSQLGNLGQMQTAAGQTQQQFGLNAAQAAQQAQAQDYQRQMGALSNIAGLAQEQQRMGYVDSAALEAAGGAQQQQVQQQLNAAQQQFQNEQLFPQQQMDWLSTQVRGMAPITPQMQTRTGGSSGNTYSASPLSQLASGLYTYKGMNEFG